MKKQLKVEADQDIPCPMEKVPMLGEIQFLGRLFRKDLRNVEKREIISP